MIKQITCTIFGCIESIPIPVGFPACNSAQGHFRIYSGFERLILVFFVNASILFHFLLYQNLMTKSSKLCKMVRAIWKVILGDVLGDVTNATQHTDDSNESKDTTEGNKDPRYGFSRV